MTRALVAVVVVAVAVGVGLVLRRRQHVAAPTQPSRAIPAQLDRADFASSAGSTGDTGDAPWLVAVFSSATCESCAAVLSKATVLRSADVAVVEVEYGAMRDIHRKYDIQVVPMVAIADSEGVVRAGFAGPVTAEDLWGALADVRSNG